MILHNSQTTRAQGSVGISPPAIVAFRSAKVAFFRGAKGDNATARAPSHRRPFLTLAGLLVWAVLGWAVLGCHPLSARAQQAEPVTAVPNEYTVKAVFLYNFGRYVEWPANTFRDATEAFVIGVVGADPFAGALDEIAKKKTLQDRRIVVVRFASPEQCKQPCHILFVSQSLPPDQQAALAKSLAGTAVLVVGETAGFVQNGGGVNFVIEEGRVRFEINLDKARQAGLRIDSRLLKLAKTVGSQHATVAN